MSAVSFAEIIPFVEKLSSFELCVAGRTTWAQGAY